MTNNVCYSKVLVGMCISCYNKMLYSLKDSNIIDRDYGQCSILFTHANRVVKRVELDAKQIKYVIINEIKTEKKQLKLTNDGRRLLIKELKSFNTDLK